jgi:cytochrome c oxidase subunit 3
VPQVFPEIEELVEESQERDRAAARLADGGGPPPGGNFGNGGDPQGWRRDGTPQSTYTVGMVVGLGASSMFFMALISASVVHRGMPGSDWVPLHPPSLLWLNSVIALASSITLVQARRMFKAGRERSFHQWWIATAILGVGFLAGQILAWRQLVSAGVYLLSNPSVGFFYVFTAAHGLHLVGGVIALLWIGWRQSRGWRRSRGISANTATSVAALYWHFVTALWLFLFSFFLIGG